MPEPLAPTTLDALRDELRRCTEDRASLETGGSFTKHRSGGPVARAERRLTTRRMNGLLAYEPADLTVSVEAGMRFADLASLLAENKQHLPLDPPYGSDATVGGVLAANASGPRRRHYGTARDMVIGMRFVTMSGRVVSSGGMVVKNVTGLDMGKLMIGSYGTLAVIASANFKTFPRPESSETLLFRSPTADALVGLSREILRGVLQPVAIDLLDPVAAGTAGLGGRYALLVETSGSAAATTRVRESFLAMAAGSGTEAEAFDGDAWEGVRECEPRWIEAHPEGAVIRAATVASRIGELLASAGDAGCGAAVHAGNAMGDVLAPDKEAARAVLDGLREKGIRATLESASDSVKAELVAWSAGGNELEIMRRIKADFDPLNLLNPGRLYGLI